MEEKEIDQVLADDLRVGDIIKVPDYGLVTVTKVDADDFIVWVWVDADPDDPFTYQWDERITLYGY